MVVNIEDELQLETACKPYLLYSYVMRYTMCNFRRPENLGIDYILESFFSSLLFVSDGPHKKVPNQSALEPKIL